MSTRLISDMNNIILVKRDQKGKHKMIVWQKWTFLSRWKLVKKSQRDLWSLENKQMKTQKIVLHVQFSCINYF